MSAECQSKKGQSCSLTISSSDDEEFEMFLSRMKTPKSLAHQVPKKQNDSLSDFIVDSREDFFSDFKRKEGTMLKDVWAREKPVARGKENACYREQLRLEFLSDSDTEDSVFIKSTWRDRHQKSGEKGLKKNLRRTKQPPSHIQKDLAFSKYNLSPSLDEKEQGCEGESTEDKIQTLVLQQNAMVESDISEDEFESLIERVKKRSTPLTPSLPMNKTTVCQPATKELENFRSSCESIQQTVQRERIQRQNSESLLKDASSSSVPCTRLLEIQSVNCMHPSLSEKRSNLCPVPGCFLQDLSKPTSQYVKDFRRKKEVLTEELYSLYNSTIFEQKLPEKMEIIWNKKMRKTAGYCVTGQTKGPELQRYARIELSEKVCDSADRLRDTLIHEVCHAATWIINGIRDGHGPIWRFYAKKSTVIHPELPMVTRCHSYEIKYKFTYECSVCKATIGRHSKSLDTERFVCAHCRGQLVLCQSSRKDGTPVRTQLTPFAKYVKENYGSTKKKQHALSHAEVMRKLSADFASKTRLLDS
ncbi:germ cell nuclear acidic protein isoform X4 [Alligator mississippiensis]|nr:germ cell nuclear acidic protein isoform X4 [Alligator mississippiensis]XP_059588956.1 germ cell nuclear acidic protein isoform X4 [Alligator mississippiensis]XP_059588957.1 germ cell nuclear acidic protein isoform X4 [Alligator mississippiensis]XP_059588958.1 germ cell nuclear acidic protein isoform X4 [Alligator mississippiensis]